MGDRERVGGLLRWGGGETSIWNGLGLCRVGMGERVRVKRVWETGDGGVGGEVSRGTGEGGG